MAQITVGYERKFSDGNYGSEGLSLTYTVDYDDSQIDLAVESEVVDGRCRVIADALRQAVLSWLSESNAPRVAYMARNQLSPPVLAAPTVGAGPAQVDLEDLPF